MNSKREHINKYAALARVSEKGQKTFFSVGGLNGLSLDVGMSQHPKAKVCIRALEGYCDENRRFTNFLPSQKDRIEQEVYKSMMALIYDYGGSLESPRILDQGWPDWARAESIINNFDEHHLMNNEELFECGVNIKEIPQRVSLRIFGLYDDSNNVFVAVCIDPYHLVFPNSNHGDGFVAHHSRTYTASLKDYFLDGLKINGRMFDE